MNFLRDSIKVKHFDEKSQSFAAKLHDKEKLTDDSNDDEDDCDNICTKVGLERSTKYFLQNTTLHGLKYVSEERLTISERIFFGLSFAIVAIFSAIFISNIYAKWSASPIIIVTSAKQTLTSEIPFPAVTICNLNMALKSEVAKLSPWTENFTLLMSLCDQGNQEITYYRGTWRYFKIILEAVAQPCQSMLLYCSYGAKIENCSMIFNSVLTDEGLCCTFNALDQSFLLQNFTDDNRFSTQNQNYSVPIDWTPEKGYGKNLPENFFPRVAGGTGSRMGLTVILNASSSEYYCSKSKSVGFKVLVHSPAEQPKISNYGFLITSGREARIPIEPIYQDAIPTIRYVGKNVRRCLFSDEGDLIYYRTYSRKNCELECEAKILLEQCNCSLYYLPRLNPSVRICGPRDNSCTNRVQLSIESSGKNLSCSHCWPACYELTYKPALSATPISNKKYTSIDDYPKEIFNGTKSDISILQFYYLSDTFRSTTKTEVFGFTEFLSNTGGILSLFMGFSIFSIIEIIFFITVRPYCASRSMKLKHKKRKEKGIKYPTPQRRPSYKKDLNLWQNNKEIMEKRQNLQSNYKKKLHNVLVEQQRINHRKEIIYPYLD